MDLNEMMNQAKELQSRVEKAQNALGDVSVKGLAGNGAVVIEMTGKYDITSVIISNDAMKNTPEVLSKIVIEAFMDAKHKIDIIIDKTMSQATQGINLPF